MARMSDARDNFEDASISESAWVAFTQGSATIAETSGQIRFTLPSSTAGTHIARLTSRYTHSLESDSFYINIQTMVATGVAATAFFDVFIDYSNVLQWIQGSNVLYARTVIDGVTVDRFNATWNATTYKYLRIRESAGNVLWESSTNGTSWTTRFTMAAPFAVTDLYIDFGVAGGNIASPGSFRLDDVNLILPALTTNWRWIQAVWPLVNRHRTVTLALDTAGTAQAYLVTADDTDASGNPTGNVRYWSGPAGGGRLLTEQTTQAAAEAMAVNVPVDGRFDIDMIDGRVFRLYVRSVDGSAFTIREMFPRRLVQTDDMEAESVTTLILRAGAVTADKIDVYALNGKIITGSTIQTAETGARVVLSHDTEGGIIGYGASDTYNTTTGVGTYQILWSKLDGKFYGGAGAVIIDEDGFTLENSTTLYDAQAAIHFTTAGVERGRIYQVETATSNTLDISPIAASGKTTSLALGAAGASGSSNKDVTAALGAQYITDIAYVRARYLGASGTTKVEISAATTTIDGGLSVGGASGAVTGEIRAEGDHNATRLALKSNDSNDVTAYLAAGEPGVSFTNVIVSNNWRASGGAMGRDDGGFGASYVRLSPAAVDVHVVSSGGTDDRVVEFTSTLIRPRGAGLVSLGDATTYFNDISYKTITDRGCLALIDAWELPDGRRVSNTEALLSLRADPSKQTLYGERMLDYSSVAKHSHKPAPVAIEDIYEDDPSDLDSQGKPKKKRKYRAGDKMGEDGVEMTSMFSQMLGSLRELAARVTALEEAR